MNITRQNILLALQDGPLSKDKLFKSFRGSTDNRLKIRFEKLISVLLKKGNILVVVEEHEINGETVRRETIQLK